MEQGAYLWSKLALANYILKAIGDGMEMSHSIEGRPPFLDHRLFDWCTTVPIHHKFHQGREKHLLREAMKPHLPSWVCQRPKHPFIAPPLLIRNGRVVDFAQDILRSTIVQDVPFVSRSKLAIHLDSLTVTTQIDKQRQESILMLLLSACMLAQQQKEISCLGG